MKCFKKMIIDCPKKQKCRVVDEEVCEDIPIRKCKTVKVTYFVNRFDIWYSMKNDIAFLQNILYTKYHTNVLS